MQHIGWLVVLACAGGCGFLFEDADDDGYAASAVPGPDLYDPADDEDEDGGHHGVILSGGDNNLPEDEMCACKPLEQPIHVLSDDGRIFSFDPEEKQFRFVTYVDCAQRDDFYGMAISRKGRAWIEFRSGDLFTVDLHAVGQHDLGGGCHDPQVRLGDDDLFCHYGLAFVPDGPWDPCDRLVLRSHSLYTDGGALATVDPRSLEMSRIGAVDATFGTLAATPDGRLFALEGVGAPTKLTQYDPRTAEVLGQWPMPGLASDEEVDPLLNYAFVHDGRYFYIFTLADSGEYSRVIRYDHDEVDGDGRVGHVIMEKTPMRILGAGATICAPDPPQ